MTKQLPCHHEKPTQLSYPSAQCYADSQPSKPKLTNNQVPVTSITLKVPKVFGIATSRLVLLAHALQVISSSPLGVVLKIREMVTRLGNATVRFGD